MIDVINEHVSEFTDPKVASITLALGEYSGVDPDSLRMVFPFAAEGTAADGAELIIRTIPVSVTCSDCGASADEIGLHLCPQCGSRNLEFVSGRELEIISFEIADDG